MPFELQMHGFKKHRIGDGELFTSPVEFGDGQLDLREANEKWKWVKVNRKVEKGELLTASDIIEEKKVKKNFDKLEIGEWYLNRAGNLIQITRVGE